MNSVVLTNFFKKYFSYFSFFYSHLRYRVFISFIASLFVGILDGFGLAMFLPLLQMIDEGSHVNKETMGKMSFLIDLMEGLDIEVTLYSVLLLMLFFFVFKGIMKFFETFLRVIYQQMFIRNIRVSNIQSFSKYNYKAFVSADSGRIQNTFTGEVERVNQAYKSYFTSIQAGILVLVYLSMAYLSNPQFAILITVGGGLTNFIFRKMYATTKRISRQLTSDTHGFQGLLIQMVLNFKYLRATGLISKYSVKLIDKILQLEKSHKRIGILASFLQSLREPITIFVVVVVIIIQVKLLSVSLGLIILSLLFFYRALTFLMSTQNNWNTFLGVSGSLENITEFSDDLRKHEDNPGKRKFNKFESSLFLNNVSFEFEKNSILKNVTLEIKKNEIVAIVGQSGAGKTTLINLISGLYHASSGKILVDGTDLYKFNLNTFQDRVGYITQEPVIFNDTVFNNITFWAEQNNSNLNKFYEAMKKAACYDFVMDLELKGDTLLGNNGINLSGGQRQRISIAREFFKNIDFLMMDEATSSLDSETESIIKENIERLKGKYTIVIVAHRLSTIKNADRVVLLEKGTITAEGSFESLVQQSSLFKKMLTKQSFDN